MRNQTRFFYLMLAIYMIALAWSTIQAFARLEYSRTTTMEKQQK